MSRIDFLESVKKLLPRTEMAIMTGYGSIETAVQAMKLGAYDYITKPFDLDDAVALAARALPDEVAGTPTPASVPGTPQLIGDTPAMRALFRAIGRLAPAPLSVLVTGETGT
jgi:two-component system nitrogen regulation response regulator GlnG